MLLVVPLSCLYYLNQHTLELLKVSSSSNGRGQVVNLAFRSPLYDALYQLAEGMA